MIKTVCSNAILKKDLMVMLGATRSVSFCLLSLTATATLLTVHPQTSQAQTPTAPNNSAEPSGNGTEPQGSNEDLRPLTQEGALLSVKGGQHLMQEASAAVSAQNYDLAVQKLQEARQVFNQLSNFYQDLAQSFSGIDLRIADVQRKQALDTAQMRDEATYQLALVHRAQNKPELAVPLLVQIIRSQNPTRDLGQRAYQQLYELGFVDSPFKGGGQGNSSNSSSAPRQ